jgi:hypothetical protein
MLSYRFRTSASTRTRKTPSRWSLYFFNGLLTSPSFLSVPIRTIVPGSDRNDRPVRVFNPASSPLRTPRPR